MKLEDKRFTSIDPKGKLIDAVSLEDAIDYGVDCYKKGVDAMKNAANKIIEEVIKKNKDGR